MDTSKLHVYTAEYVMACGVKYCTEYFDVATEAGSGGVGLHWWASMEGLLA